MGRGGHEGKTDLASAERKRGRAYYPLLGKKKRNHSERKRTKPSKKKGRLTDREGAF